MRICIFSDIHGNAEAFHKMYEIEHPQTDIFLFAGDIFGYFHEQKQIIDAFMREDRLFAIMGNHDYNYLQTRRHAIDREALVDSYGSSYNITLPTAQLTYLEQLPRHLELELAGRRFGIFHGGPENYLDQRIYPDTPLPAELPDKDYDYCIIGHTHYRFIRKKGNTTLINPGSLGQPRDGKGFSYCILDIEGGSCQFKTVELDIKALISNAAKRDKDKKVCRYLKQKYGEL